MVILPCLMIFFNTYSYITAVFLMLYNFGLVFRLIGMSYKGYGGKK